MKTNQIGVSLRSSPADLANVLSQAGSPAGDPANARRRHGKDDRVVYYTGRSYQLRPDQTRRASEFLSEQAMDTSTDSSPRSMKLSVISANSDGVENDGRSEERSAYPRNDIVAPRSQGQLTQHLHELQRSGIQEELAALRSQGAVRLVRELTDLKRSEVVAKAKAQLASQPSKPMPQATLNRFAMVGVRFSRSPASYAEMLSIIEAAVRPEWVESIKPKLKSVDLNDAPRPGKTQSILSKLAWKSEGTWDRCAREHGGEQTHAFKQIDFIKGSTIGAKGVCLPLTLKWLTSQKLSAHERDWFYRDIDTQGGREEVMRVALDSYVRKDVDAIVDYIRAYGMTFRDSSNRAGFQIQLNGDGLYKIGITPSEGDGHSVAARVDHARQVFTFFDPDSGEYALPSAKALEAFAKDYLWLAYPTMDKDTRLIHLDPAM